MGDEALRIGGWPRPASYAKLGHCILAPTMLGGDRASRAEALKRYEQASDLPLLFLALAIIPLLVLPLTFDLSPAFDRAFTAIDWSIVAVFAADLCIRLYLSDHRLGYAKAHWFDVLIVALPFLRPLRVLRSARALRLVRLSRAGSYSARSFATAKELLHRRGLGYVLAAALFLLVLCAWLIYAFERNSGGSINSFGAALWWSIMTMTTIGGNTQPVTVEGRGVAVFLMIVGISLFGFITANIAAFLVAQGQDAPATTLAEIAAKLDSLELEFRALRRAVSGTSSIGSEEAHTSSNGEELDPKKIVSAGPLE